MTKRRNPYLDDFEPQMKIHVGLKQMYNNNEDKMKSVYDKTIGMLFEAANQKTSNTNTTQNSLSNEFPGNLPHSVECAAGVTTERSYAGKKQLKQTFFGKNGSLQRNGRVVLDSPVNVHPCRVCSTQPADPWESCAYCESLQCASCSLTCIQCNNLTCSNCSFPCYNSLGNVLCVSCSR